MLVYNYKIPCKDISEANGHRLLFLPPYIPYLNPIDEVISV